MKSLDGFVVWSAGDLLAAALEFERKEEERVEAARQARILAVRSWLTRESNWWSRFRNGLVGEITDQKILQLNWFDNTRLYWHLDLSAMCIRKDELGEDWVAVAKHLDSRTDVLVNTMDSQNLSKALAGKKTLNLVKG